VVVPDDLEERAVKAMREAANTGHIGDGKVFVYDVERAVRIRTGETGEDAL
jgi:nitrogen regulatory protein PII